MNAIMIVLSLLLLAAPAYAGPTGQQINSPITSDFFFDVVTGDAPGFSAILKYGENPDIVTADGFATIWDGGGTYVAPTQARLHDIASTLAADAGTVLSSGTVTSGSGTTLVDSTADFTADGVAAGDIVLNDSDVKLGFVFSVPDQFTLNIVAEMRDPEGGLPEGSNDAGEIYRVVRDASTGASVLFVNGIGADRAALMELVVTNGMNAVATTGFFSMINRMRVFATSSTDLEGTLTATAQTDGTVTAQIINGNNHTLMAVYRCPVTDVCHVVKWWGSISKKQNAVSVMHFRTGILGGMTYVVQTRAIDSSASSTFEYNTDLPIVVPGGADMWVEANTDTNNIGIASGFDVVLKARSN